MIEPCPRCQRPADRFATKWGILSLCQVCNGAFLLDAMKGWVPVALHVDDEVNIVMIVDMTME